MPMKMGLMIVGVHVWGTSYFTNRITLGSAQPCTRDMHTRQTDTHTHTQRERERERERERC